MGTSVFGLPRAPRCLQHLSQTPVWAALPIGNVQNASSRLHGLPEIAILHGRGKSMHPHFSSSISSTSDCYKILAVFGPPNGLNNGSRQVGKPIFHRLRATTRLPSALQAALWATNPLGDPMLELHLAVWHCESINTGQHQGLAFSLLLDVSKLHPKPRHLPFRSHEKNQTRDKQHSPANQNHTFSNTPPRPALNQRPCFSNTHHVVSSLVMNWTLILSSLHLRVRSSFFWNIAKNMSTF